MRLRTCSAQRVGFDVRCRMTLCGRMCSARYRMTQASGTPVRALPPRSAVFRMLNTSTRNSSFWLPCNVRALEERHIKLHELGATLGVASEVAERARRGVGEAGNVQPAVRAVWIACAVDARYRVGPLIGGPARTRARRAELDGIRQTAAGEEHGGHLPAIGQRALDSLVRCRTATRRSRSATGCAACRGPLAPIRAPTTGHELKSSPGHGVCGDTMSS